MFLCLIAGAIARVRRHRKRSATQVNQNLQPLNTGDGSEMSTNKYQTHDFMPAELSTRRPQSPVELSEDNPANSRTRYDRQGRMPVELASRLQHSPAELQES